MKSIPYHTIPANFSQMSSKEKDSVYHRILYWRKKFVATGVRVKKRYEELPPQFGRRVIRCKCCHMVQFWPESGFCRRSGMKLESLPEQPETPSVIAIPSSPAPNCGYDFAFAFQYCRWLTGLSSRQVALKMGVKRSYISKVENGRCFPRIENVERYAAAVGRTSTEIMDIAQVLGAR